jgi:hypothetical protein
MLRLIAVVAIPEDVKTPQRQRGQQQHCRDALFAARNPVPLRSVAGARHGKQRIIISKKPNASAAGSDMRFLQSENRTDANSNTRTLGILTPVK